MAHRIERVVGRACVLRGHDIDTDRILPARFLRSITFDGLGEHAFKDDRAQAKGDHPLDDERFAGANVLLVGLNFGCGSSREHAPQSLMRCGFEAFVGGSFAEIFAGNCTALGLPCLVLEMRDLDTLMNAVDARPEQQVVVDVRARTVTCDVGTFPATIPEGTREQLLEGSWHGTAVLLEVGEEIERTAARLPYVSGFRETDR
jgi:3-isopropylmalate/(R)-2-methylmalate dehydratase small subunit